MWIIKWFLDLFSTERSFVPRTKQMMVVHSGKAFFGDNEKEIKERINAWYEEKEKAVHGAKE